MSNDQQPDPRPEPEPAPHSPSPQRGWGGEYDSDTTAFIEFPPGGHPAGPGDDPLAAPGHGYQPPELGRLPGPLPTPEATTDPAATGQWTMPFAYGGPPEPGGAPSRAAAMGQGAAAALGGSLQDQAGRRPPGPGRAGEEGAGVAELAPGHEPADPAGPWPPAGGSGPGTAAVADLPAPWSMPPGGAPHPTGTEPGTAAVAERTERFASQVPAPAPEAAQEAKPAEPAEAAEAAEAAVVADPAETAGAAETGDPAVPVRSEHPEVSYVLRVNGIDRPVSAAWIGESLLYVLRERLGLAGAKDGCAQGECGACSVQVDGRLVAACLVPAATVAGGEIRTVEGLGADGVLSDVQRALAASTAVQCGFCLPGMAMTVHDLLEGNHAPTDLQTREALCGNLCRCSGYRGVLDAVRAVVSERAAVAGPPEADEGPQPPPGAPARIPHQAGPAEGDLR